MTGSPAAGLVRAWVSLYTRGLPAEARAARRDEIADDLWCELEEAATLGRSAATLGADMVLRLLFGMPADIGWRLTYRGTPRSGLERSLTMNNRALGLVALAAGLSWTGMLIMFVAIGDAIWRGSLGGWTVLVTLIGAIGFPLCSISLAYQSQDRLGLLSAVGAGMAVIGALAGVAGSGNWIAIMLLPLGSAILLWDVAGSPVMSRLAPIAQALTAVGIAVVGIAGLPLDGELAIRARTALIFAPFVLSWVALGLSLIRRSQPQSVAGGSPV